MVEDPLSGAQYSGSALSHCLRAGILVHIFRQVT